MDYIYILLGLAGLIFGGEALVRGSVNLTRRMGISPLIIGLTVVGFGTSTPELLVSVQAALRGVPDIAIGNIVGSNIANILLIVGLTALVWPIRVAGASYGRDAAVMIAAALLLLPLFALGSINRLAGLLLMAGLAIYLVQTLKNPGEMATDDDSPVAVTPVWISVLWVAAGLAAVMFGAQFLVDGATSVARILGVSEAFIGLTIVAVGTSLPELATSLVAAFRRQSEIAIGNILGSNVFNVLGVLGVTAFIAPIPVAPRFLTFDLPIMILASFVLAGLLHLRPQIGRGIGALMLLGYMVYVFLAQ
ncbi:MAG: calcium/sodium antiporter [Albidovulum sp.]